MPAAPSGRRDWQNRDVPAPPAQFDAVERSVFGAVRRSLTLIRSGGA